MRDNGKGISEKVMEFQPDRIGVGIAGMKQRAKEWGGNLEIANANPGTIVQVTIPVTVGVRREATTMAFHQAEKIAK